LYIFAKFLLTLLRHTLYTDDMEEMIRTKRETNKINCRERILKASRRLFASKGYEETMMEDIAQLAGVSKATVYNYFPNKESLLAGTVDEVVTEVETMLAAASRETDSGDMLLRRTMAVFINASMKYPKLARRISYLNSCQESALYATANRKVLQILYTLVRKAQEDGTFRREARADDIVDVLMGLYFIAQFQWPDTGRSAPEELEKKLDHFFTIMMEGFYTERACR